MTEQVTVAGGAVDSSPASVLSTIDKVRLLTGRSAWETHAASRLGLRPIVFSDGPVGVRGSARDEGRTSLLLPAPSALAATWDPVAAAVAGRLLAGEARRRGIDVVLAPVVNLQRTPAAGRHFEYFSEDPLLTADIATALVRAMQDEGVAACLKHFVANDSETDRTQYLAVVDERTLREVYLAPFERVIREANPWLVMAAYNGVRAGGVDAPATEHAHLLTGILKGEWAYDGVVVSDWLAARSTVATAVAGLDLVMPGPGGPWEGDLVDAVRSGAVPGSMIDDKIDRLVRLADRVGARGDSDARPAPDDLGARGDLRWLAARSTVLLRNDEHAQGPLLPIRGDRLRSMVLVGGPATDPFVQGGGSALVSSRHVVTPFEALREALPPETDLATHPGVPVTGFAPSLDLALVADPATGEAGVGIELLDREGRILGTRHVHPWSGRYDVEDDAVTTVRLRALVRLPGQGEHQLAVGTVGTRHVRVDGVVADEGGARAGSEVILDSSVNEPPDVPVDISVDDERVVDLMAELQVIDGEGYGRFARAELRHRPPGPTVEQSITEAAAAAAVAEVAIVFVGTTIEAESEGRDRSSLALPGHQDELVRRVTAANPRTVVVVNAGGPVLLPWLDDPAPGAPAAVLWWWLPGQEAGHALAAVLLGDLEPAGRLPWTLPEQADDVPVPDAVPVDGAVVYHEEVDVGYRSWQRLGRRPARPFGAGMGWGRWRYDHLEVSGSFVGDDLSLAVTITNVGSRVSDEVVQVYVSEDAPGAVRRLAGSSRADVGPGATRTVVVRVPGRALERWEPGHGWRPLAPTVRLVAGRDVEDVRLATLLELHERPTHVPHESARHAEDGPATAAGSGITTDVDNGEDAP